MSVFFLPNRKSSFSSQCTIMTSLAATIPSGRFSLAMVPQVWACATGQTCWPIPGALSPSGTLSSPRRKSMPRSRHQSVNPIRPYLHSLLRPVLCFNCGVTKATSPRNSHHFHAVFPKRPKTPTPPHPPPDLQCKLRNWSDCVMLRPLWISIQLMNIFPLLICFVFVLHGWLFMFCPWFLTGDSKWISWTLANVGCYDWNQLLLMIIKIFRILYTTLRLLSVYFCTF